MQITWVAGIISVIPFHGKGGSIWTKQFVTTGYSQIARGYFTLGMPM